MKLLLDENISFRVSKLIIENFPESKSVRDLNLEKTSDIEIWNFAKINDYVIVTFDIDFVDIGVLKGVPPSIVCLRTGNTPTCEIADKLNRLNSFEFNGIYFFDVYFFRQIV